MNTFTIHTAGETLSWNDRIAIAFLKTLGFPADYLEFVGKYGAGQFAFALRVLAPSRFLAQFDSGEIKSLEIAHMDDGGIFAVQHVDDMLIEFHPRDRGEQQKVFGSFAQVLDWILERQTPKFPLPIYEQPSLPSYSFALSKPKTVKDWETIASGLGEKLGCNDLQLARWHEIVYLFTASQGFLLRVEEGTTASLTYGLGTSPSAAISFLQKQGLRHAGNESENLMLFLLTGERVQK